MKDQNYVNILIAQLELRDTDFKDREEMMRKAEAVGRMKADYEKNHPEVREWETENKEEARVQYLGDRIHSQFENLPPFDGDPDKIPYLPVMPIEFMRSKVWPGLIRAGAIPKKDLETGREYLGSCRNASQAVWNGETFTYQRTKFGMTFPEDIKHFQDDDGTDVFIPILKL